MINLFIRGWVGYFSHFCKSALYPTFRRIDPRPPVGGAQVQAVQRASARRSRLGLFK
jgi:hypothetical protein